MLVESSSDFNLGSGGGLSVELSTRCAEATQAKILAGSVFSTVGTIRMEFK